jgi:hypothetical protein
MSGCAPGPQPFTWAWGRIGATISQRPGSQARHVSGKSALACLCKATVNKNYLVGIALRLHPALFRISCDGGLKGIGEDISESRNPEAGDQTSAAE